MKALEVARRYTQRGWSVIPVPHRSKNPGYDGWEQTRLTQLDLPHRFNGRPQNVGVLLGEPSGWLIDVDLDHARAVELADDHLPRTGLEFGRAGKRRSHRLYRVTGPLATRKFRSKFAGMIVELRSTGMQTVFPYSTHEGGEPIEWVDESAEPAEVDPEALLRAVEALATAVKVELGERVAPKPQPPRTTARPLTAKTTPPSGKIEQCVAAMLRMNMVDHNDGSSRLFAAACRAVEHDLGDGEGIAAVQAYAERQPFPTEWTVRQILDRIRDAESKVCRGSALDGDAGSLVALGQRHPESGRLVLSPKRTLPTAEAYLREFHAHAEHPTLLCYAGSLLEWTGNRYAEVEDARAKRRLQSWLHDALRYVPNKRSGGLDLVPFESNPNTVSAALESVKTRTHLPASATVPSWLAADPSLPDPTELLCCRSLTLHIPSGAVRPPTPLLFNTASLEFDYDPGAAPPELWFAFLRELFGTDDEQVAALQAWFGYCLAADTSQQKALLLIGPKRSGKGTIARVLSHLVGRANVAGPTTSSLAGAFGLQPLIGKSLAIVSDARFSGENVATVVERLLCITGEDTLTVDRKFMPSVTVKLPTRFAFLSNELPRFNDSSAALAGRFIVLRLTRSFYGNEVTDLTEQLLAELPGILLWALEGWKQLRARGRFVQPASVADAVTELEDLASPVGAFVRDRCVVGAERRCPVDDLYEAWRAWCAADGRVTVSIKQVFSRDLYAAVPGVACRQGTGGLRFYAGIGLGGPQ